MRFYKIVTDGIITGIGTGAGGTEITQDEYDSILSAIRSKPADTETVGYRLTAGMSWEAYDKEPAEVPDEIEMDEVMTVLEGIV